MKMNPTELLTRDPEEIVADSLFVMIKRELASFSCYNDYLDSSDPNMITAKDRKKLVLWCNSVVDHCQYSRDTVASAIEMVDRFLSISTPSNSTDAARVCHEALRDPIKMQLLTIAALYSSIKINERVVLSSEQFSQICSRSYTAEEIEGMERILLCGLSWRCHTPTAHQVGLSILSLVYPYAYVCIPEVTWGVIMREMEHLTELAVQDYYFSTIRNSTIALAAIFNVISDKSTKERLWLRSFLSGIMESFDFDHYDQIDAARRRLRTLAQADRAAVLLDEIHIHSDDERSLAASVETHKVSNRRVSL